MQLDELEQLPEGLLEIESRDIAQICPNPTLVHLEGERSDALFVSILLHGNEDVGLLAIQELFRHVSVDALPRSLKLFIGNVRSCTQGLRTLPDQVDFNRAWPGSDLPHSPTHELLATVVNRATQTPLFASVDIHNNTGRNPLYGCICSLEQPHVRLTSLFSDKAIFFRHPKGVQTQAFTRYCPSVTLECGRIGELRGASEASAFLYKCLWTENLSAMDETESTTASIFRTLARIRLRDQCSVGFEGNNDVILREDLDLLNFRHLPPGEVLGRLRLDLEECFVVQDQLGQDVTREFLTTLGHSGGQHVAFGKTVMPSMLTKDLAVMRQDCVGYLMERLMPNPGT